MSLSRIGPRHVFGAETGGAAQPIRRSPRGGARPVPDRAGEKQEKTRARWLFTAEREGRPSRLLGPVMWEPGGQFVRVLSRNPTAQCIANVDKGASAAARHA